MPDVRARGPLRDLPLVVTITAAVVGLPLVVLAWAEAAFEVIIGPLPAAAVAIGLSAALGAGGSAIWMRHPRSRDVVFGDLMLWGYVRRLVNERRVLRATAALGLDRSNGEAREIALSTEKQTEILQRLANALEANDTYTSGHSRRVARHARMIAKQMGLDSEYVDKVYTAASIHDVGKMHLPHDILNKPGKLTDDEYEIVKEHSAIGAAMVSALGNGEITAIVRHHHERLDGRGYPDRLAGDVIPLGSRIIAVADTFDALTSTRAYRAASEHKKAIDILKKEAGSQLDGRVVDAFLRYYTGRRSSAGWSAITAIPERMLSWIASGIEKVGVAGLANGVTAAGAAAVITVGAVGGPAPTADMDRTRFAVASVDGNETTTTGADADAADATADGSDASVDDGRADRDARDGGSRSSKTETGGSSDGTGEGSGPSSSESSSEGTGSDSSGSGSSGSGSSGSGSGGSDSDNSGPGSDSSGSGSDGSDSDNSGPGSDSSGSGSDGSGDDSDNSGSGSSGSGSSGSGSSGSGDDDGLIGEVVESVEDVECGLLGLLC